MKKNIIFPIEFNHLTGGMIHSVVSLIKSLSKNYKVYIVVHKDAEIAQLGLDASPLFLKKPWSIGLGAPLKTLRTHLEVRKLLRNFDKNDTLVFTNNVGSEMIFSGFGFFPIPLNRIFVSRGGDYKGKTGWILKKGFKSAKELIAISESQNKKLRNVCSAKTKITTIHNGVSMDNPSNYLPKFDKAKIKIAVIGYLSENKNQILAVKALTNLIQQNRNVTINFYGLAFMESDKVYKRKLINEINNRKLENNVLFPGFESDKEKMYQNTDIVLSCSLSEGFGRTIVEAMAFGIPCIGLAQSGGLVDIIIDRINGRLIQNDSEELTDAIVEYLDNKEFREQISQNAIETYKMKFTESKMCESYEALIQNIL